LFEVDLNWQEQSAIKHYIFVDRRLGEGRKQNELFVSGVVLIMMTLNLETLPRHFRCSLA
jgi:hypothetical protein